MKQSFATNSEVFYLDNTIEKENKIVFIGNNYFEVVTPTSNYKNSSIMLNLISRLFNVGKLDRAMLNTLAERYVDDGSIKSHEHYK